MTNPTQEGAARAARHFTDEESAPIRSWHRAVKYVALDVDLPILPGPTGFRGQFPRWPWAESTRGGICADPDLETGPVPRSVFFADYFRTLLYRLWRYGGAAATPTGPVLAVRLPDAARRAEVRKFPSWGEADAFVRNAGAPWRIACGDPVSTCVPLEAWPGFHRVYSSPTDALRSSRERVARVEMLMRNP